MATCDLSRWVLMWLTAGIIFLASKGLAWRAAPERGRFVVWLAWPGLDAGGFFAAAAKVAQPSIFEWLSAAAKTAFGAGLFWLGGAMAHGNDLLRGWVGMIGVVFVLHFGLFHLLSCLWRRAGYDAPPIMNHPWAATSLSDFWGRRWNRAFRDLAHRFFFLPLAKSVKPRLALLLGFVFSGLIHEVVITVPAGGGYGGPTAYFCLQGLGVTVEHSRFGKSLGLAHGWRGRVFAALVVLGPVGLLFPPVFICNIVLPMMDALGAA